MVLFLSFPSYHSHIWPILSPSTILPFSSTIIHLSPSPSAILISAPRDYGFTQGFGVRRATAMVDICCLAYRIQASPTGSLERVFRCSCCGPVGTVYYNLISAISSESDASLSTYICKYDCFRKQYVLYHCFSSKRFCITEQARFQAQAHRIA